MVSKVLFLVLVGCVFVLAKPVDESTAVEKPKDNVNVEVVEISPEEAKKIIKELEDQFKNIWEKISNPSSHESVEGVFDEIKNIFDKIIEEHKLELESAESAESAESQETAKVQETPKAQE